MKLLSNLLSSTDLKNWCLRHVTSIGSTNSTLLTEGKEISKWDVPVVLVADHQTDGRGRRGKSWLSMPGSSILCSVGVTLPLAIDKLTGLSLAVSLAIVEALENFLQGRPYVLKKTIQRQFASQDEEIFKLKWPNDVLLTRRKLGGVLIEAVKSDLSKRGQRICSQSALNRWKDQANHANLIAESTNVVIGFAVNLTSPKNIACVTPYSLYADDSMQKAKINAPKHFHPAYLDELVFEWESFRYSLLANILQFLNAKLVQFKKHGFVSMQNSWLDRHIYNNKEVIIYENGIQCLKGKAVGIDQQGRLLVDIGNEVRSVVSGDLDSEVEFSMREAV